MDEKANKNRVMKNGSTFLIDIKGQQHNTWQGTVMWTKTQQKVSFRSALELIRLLDSAVNSQEEE